MEPRQLSWISVNRLVFLIDTLSVQSACSSREHIVPHTQIVLLIGPHQSIKRRSWHPGGGGGGGARGSHSHYLTPRKKKNKTAAAAASVLLQLYYSSIAYIHHISWAFVLVEFGENKIMGWLESSLVCSSGSRGWRVGGGGSPIYILCKPRTQLVARHAPTQSTT